MTALLDNASKFSQPKGQVSVCLERSEDWVMLSGEDHRIGTDSHIRPWFFNRFFHLERPVTVSTAA